MSAKSSSGRESLPRILKLSESQIEKIAETVDKLWATGALMINSVEEDMQISMKRSEVDKIEIPGLSQSEIRDLISASMVMIDVILVKSDIKKIAEYYKVSSDDIPKLEQLITIFKNLKSLHEIAYQSSTNSPVIDLRSFDYNTKKFDDSNISISVASINFSIKSRGEAKFVFFETTISSLRRLINELKDVEKDLEEMEK